MRLRFQKRALQQIDKALSYVAAQSPQSAARLEARLSDILARVQRYPHMGKKAPIAGVRRVYLTPYPYHVDYFAGRDEIVVQRFRHTARRPLSGEGGA